MTKKKARERFFRTQWLPAAASVDPSAIATAPLSMLLDVYASVYYLGPRGLIIEQQLAIMKKLSDADHMQFRRAVFLFHGDFNQQMRKAGTEAFAWYSDRLHLGHRLSTPELPDVRAYFDYQKERAGWLARRSDRASFELFVGASANYTAISKRADRVTTYYNTFCDRWAIPNI